MSGRGCMFVDPLCAGDERGGLDPGDELLWLMRRARDEREHVHVRANASCYLSSFYLHHAYAAGNLPVNIRCTFRFRTFLCIAHMALSALAARVGPIDPMACHMAREL